MTNGDLQQSIKSTQRSQQFFVLTAIASLAVLYNGVTLASLATNKALYMEEALYLGPSAAALGLIASFFILKSKTGIWLVILNLFAIFAWGYVWWFFIAVIVPDVMQGTPSG